MPDDEVTTSPDAASAEDSPSEAEPPEEIDDTVPCPACHQPVRFSYLADKYASDVPAKFRPRSRKEG